MDIGRRGEGEGRKGNGTEKMERGSVNRLFVLLILGPGHGPNQGYKKLKPITYVAPKTANCNRSGALRHRQRGRTAYRL